MAVITPNTDLYLLKVPLEINDINQLDFANATAQYNYFNSLPKISVDDFTYQRKDNVIRFPAQFDEIITYNYCMYRNTEYSNKWFYAFITDMEYVSDGMTRITIKTDVWQSWQFDLTYKPCLIDREHTNDDTVGANTLPENLELGEIVANGHTRNFGIRPDTFDPTKQFMVVVDVSMIENAGQSQTLTYSWSDSGTTPDSGSNGIPSGVFHIITDIYTYGGSYPRLKQLIKVYNYAGLADAITNVYILPYNIVSSVNIQEGLTLSTTGSASPATASNLSMVKAGFQNATYMERSSYDRPNKLDGYTPRNKKLLCYPFNYINVSNNAGTVIPFHYEDFQIIPTGSTPRAEFEVEGAFCPSGSIKAVPLNYKNLTYGDSDNRYDYSITGAKFPICSWNVDAYTNWLTQNAVNMATEWKTTAMSAIGDIGGGALVGGMAGGIMGAVGAGKSLIGTAREQMLAKTSANMVADQAGGNINAGDVVFSKHGCAFTFMPMSIKAEYARCADAYLDMFGYATNRIKLPNIRGRRNWNYVKTVGCYIEADIPQEDLAEIKGMFDNGVTFWHNASTFADYSQNNDII